MPTIRFMKETDVTAIEDGFLAQAWEGRRTVLEKYWQEQSVGQRWVLVAETNQQVAGYVTLLKDSSAGPFQGQNFTEIADFNVFEAFQKQGIGNLLLARAEEKAKEFSSTVTLGVGLHSGYGAAQRLYVKRGYLPDGSGIWYNNQQLGQGEPCLNDDELVLYFSKNLEK